MNARPLLLASLVLAVLAPTPVTRAEAVCAVSGEVVVLGSWRCPDPGEMEALLACASTECVVSALPDLPDGVWVSHSVGPATFCAAVFREGEGVDAWLNLTAPCGAPA